MQTYTLQMCCVHQTHRTKFFLFFWEICCVCVRHTLFSFAISLNIKLYIQYICCMHQTVRTRFYLVLMENIVCASGTHILFLELFFPYLLKTLVCVGHTHTWQYVSLFLYKYNNAYQMSSNVICVLETHKNIFGLYLKNK